MKKYLRTLPFLGLLLICSPQFAQACAVCFGDPKSPLTIGAKAGVFFMLSILGLVLGGILTAIIFFARRAKLVEVQTILKGDPPSSMVK